MSYVITIGRQFGCGAREIGTKLAERMNISYYDKEIIKRTSKESGFDEDLFKFYDEKPTNSFLFNVSADGFIPMGNTGLSLEDQIIQFQFDTIKKVADEGSCIIVGRCADYILRENKNLISVYLHADEEYRKKRIIAEYNCSDKEALKQMKATDKKRAKFHNFYSDNSWGDAATYDLSIDVSKLGIDNTVDLIAEYVQKAFE